MSSELTVTKCPTCGNEMEVILKYGTPIRTTCPECGTDVYDGRNGAFKYKLDEHRHLNLLGHRPGETIYVDLFDWMSATVRVIRDGLFSCVVEYIDGIPCYSQTTLLHKPGDRITLHRKEIYAVNGLPIRHTKKVQTSEWLPF